MDPSTAFRLDSANQCLWRRTDAGAWERVLLTATEYRVIEHLVEHPLRLVTHRELLDAVWPRTAIEPQAVKSRIFRLRRALGDDPKQPRFIETVSRRGYRFVGEIERRGAEEPPRAAPQDCLVGREGAIASLWEGLRQARAGTFELVFVTGEAGIGKTALAGEFLRQVSIGDQAVVLCRGQCVEGFGSKEPFYPVLEAVGELCRGDHGARMVGILASHAPTWLVQFPALLTREHRESLRQEILGATRERMLREICAALELFARTTPLLLVLEDLHWSDPSTLDLLSALARRHHPARMMVIATYRPVEVARAAHPLNALKRDLAARHQCRELVLSPLSQADLARYLRGERPTLDDQAELASLLHRHTEGNPLYMIGVLEQLVGRGFVERTHGAWTLRRPAAEISVEVPESLRDLIAAQVEQLGEAEQHVLEIAAIAGMLFAPVICAASARLDLMAFDDCCDALARRGHILRFADDRQLPDGCVVQRYAFVHALYREVLYKRQAPLRRAALHRRRAEQIEALFAGALDDVAPELAHHFEKGTDWPRTIEYLRRSAAVSARRGALERATVHLEHALALTAKLPDAKRAPIELEILDALADMYLGGFDVRAGEVLMLLRERAAQQALADVEAKALVDLVYPLAWTDGVRALDTIEQALRLSEAQQDPLLCASTRARCMARRIWIRGWRDEDAAECRRALGEVRRLGTPREIAWNVIDCHVVDLFSAAYRRASGDVIDSLAILREEGGESTHLMYANSVRELYVPWCRIMLGEWGIAMREIDAGIAQSERNGDLRGAQTLLLSRAWVHLQAMDFVGARAICEALLPAFQGTERAPWRRNCLALAGAADAGLGDRNRALARILGARDEMKHHAALGDWYWELRLQCALANLSLSAGDLTRAREEADRFVDIAGATAERSWQALAWDVSARTALASGDSSRARELVHRALDAVEEVEAPVAGWQAHATAADVHLAGGDRAGAAFHRGEARSIALALAASLGPEREALRHIFLTAEPVARLIARAGRTKASPPRRADARA